LGVDDTLFTQFKKKALVSLDRALDTGEVDTKIIPILDAINSLSCFYTTSSCAGRIMVLEVPSVGRKKEAKILGKWHHNINGQEVQECITTATRGQMWLLAQSPIFHVGVESMKDTDVLLSIAIRSGFKNSGIKTKGKKIIVEITSTERVDAPLGKDGEMMCSNKYLKFLIENANYTIERGDKKIYRLTKNLSLLQC